MNNNIFEDIEKSKIFELKDSLNNYYIPEKIIGRDKEIRKLAEILSGVFKNEYIDNFFIFGNSGSGKTCVVRYLRNELLEEARKRNIENIAFIIINARISNIGNVRQILMKILEDENFLLLAYRCGEMYDPRKIRYYSNNKIYEIVKNVIKKNRAKIIVVIDEIDEIDKHNAGNAEEILDSLISINLDLYNANEENSSGCFSIGAISCIPIKEFFGYSHLLMKFKVIEFSRYTVQHLVNILKYRASIAFHDGVFSNVAILFTAAYVANKYFSDVRYALNMLKRAGELAEKENKNFIGEEEIKKVCADAEKDVLEEILKQMSDHQKIALYTIANVISKNSRNALYDRIQIEMREAYHIYEEECRKYGEKPRSMRWFWECMKFFQDANIIHIDESRRKKYLSYVSISDYFTPNEILNILKNEIEKQNGN